MKDQAESNKARRCLMNMGAVCYKEDLNVVGSVTEVAKIRRNL